jgi:superfamily II DNA or RNA helicase
VSAQTLHADPAPHGIPELPEQGRVVEVRGATWAVTDVRKQGLSRSPADEGKAESQHVVWLQSLDEDRMGEELSVVWELEVGHTVVPDQGLPETVNADAFDDPSTLGAFVDAVRWGAVPSADAKAFQAPFRSGAKLEPYQLEPLRRALESPRTNLLLADDVGLGKTIEAGLVIEELLLRHRARSVIIVCPPSLSLKWQSEMREKFGLDFVIVDSERIAQTRRTFGLAANPFRLFPRVIVSMAWLPSVRAQRLLRDVLADAGKANSARRYAFDILVVDEAHHIAPSAPTSVGVGRGYAVDSKRTLAVRYLAAHCEHRLFLSATPHNGYSESFTALLEMIDSRRFSRGADIDVVALDEVAVRRLKSQIKSLNFKARKIKTITFRPQTDEEEMFSLLDGLLKASARQKGGQRSLDIAGLLLKKRFISSPWAFARTLATYTASSALASGWGDDDYYAEVMGSGQSDEEEGLFEQPEFEALRQAKKDDPLAAASQAQVNKLVAWGEGFEHRPNSRLSALLTMLNAICRPDGKTWTNERVVVFTEYADTVSWIVDVLRQQGYADRLEVIQGATPAEEREDIRARFAANPADEKVRVLVATDAAGEGIDLQAYCHRLVNFDVPFNPARLEQRIGRIDRYGQTKAPQVFYFAPETKGSLYAGDAEFLRRIGEKITTEVRDLGAVNPLIDDEISSHFTGRRTARNTGRAQARANENNQMLADSRDLNRQLTELGRTYQDRKQDMHLTPAASRRVVDAALRITNQPLLVPTGHPDTDAEVFDVPGLGRNWQPALAGLDTRLKPGELRPITFDDRASGQIPDLAYVHLGHALMQKAARTLRSSLFGSDSKVNRVTAVVVPDLEVSCLAAMSRLVLVGLGGLRLHEEVFVTGVRFRGHALAEDKVHALLDRALDAHRLDLASRPIRQRLARAWDADDGKLRHRLEEAMTRRAGARQEAVQESLDKRRAADTERARDIFRAFRVNLRDSLERLRSEQEEQQAMLWSDDQQRQRQADIRQIEDRLTSLDEEERREIDGIKERYADVKPYVSAVALVFAVAREDAAQWESER